MKTVAMILLCLLLCMHEQGFSQAQIADPLDRVMLPSPTAMAMTKYTEIPVSLSTGTPNISIPLYEIKTPALSLPITLSYHASGIRLSENASNVGLEWTLQAEGVITSSTLGIIDDGTYEEIGGPNWVNESIDINNPAQYQLLPALASNSRDGVPDLHMYNFNGNNGRFIIVNNEVVQLPQTNIKIRKNGSVGWIAVTEEGNQYFFEAQEYSRSRTATTVDGSITAWYLTKIVAANNTDSILLTYIDTRYNSGIGSSHTVDYFPNLYGIYQSEGNNETTYNNTIKGKQLTKIEFNNGSIEYNVSLNSRLDIINAPIVKGFVVKNKKGEILRSVEFKHDYYDGNSRLKLTEVDIKPGTGAANAEVYKLSYNSMPLPPVDSYEQDHWGYYNGASNSTLIPTWGTCKDYPEPPNCIACTTSAIFSGADRNTNGQYVTAGILEKIVYPTGGSTSFIYEPHTKKTVEPQYIYRDNNVVTFRLTHTSDEAGWKTMISDKYKVPAIAGFENGICAKFTGTIYTDAEMVNFIHANPYIALYEEETNTIVESWVFSYDETKSQYTQTKPVTLFPGKTYYIKISVRDIDCDIIGQLVALVPERKTGQDLVGGCRIKEMQFFNESGNLVKSTQYEYGTPENPLISSGQIHNYPVYTSRAFKYQRDVRQDPEDHTVCTEKEIEGVRLSSNSIWNIGAGSHISYSYVRVTEKGNANTGSTLYNYTNFDQSVLGGEFDASWRRGLLRSQTSYDNLNRKVHEIRNSYVFDDREFKNFEGRQITYFVAHPCAPPLAFNSELPVRFDFKRYFFPSEWVYLGYTEEETFDVNSGGSIVTKKRFDYGSIAHKKVTQVVSVLSNGSEMKSVFRYPHDFAGIEVYDAMISRNIISPVIEQTTFSHTSVDKELAKVKAEYDFWNNKCLIALKTKSKSTMGRLLEVESTCSKYDATMNLLEYMPKNGISSCYLWGYRSEYPVAKIAGTDYNTAVAKISQTILDNPSSDQALRDELNKLRSIPGALVTTYTYSPLIGMTSETDVNNKTTYYEYDGMGRLSIVKDKDGNVLKKLCYNYSGQAEDCFIKYYSHAKSQAFTPTISCGSGVVTPSTITYTVAESAHTSYVSQEAADQLAQDDINANGQSYANSHASCQFQSAAITGSFSRNNCTGNYVTAPVSYTLPAGAYTSSISQAAANALASANFNSLGQAYANANGVCVSCVGCTAEGKKCTISGCLTGIKVYTSSVYQGPKNYLCTYHYEFADGSVSQNYTETKITPCVILN